MSISLDPSLKEKIKESYEACWAIMEYHSVSFTFANRYLSDEERLSVGAVYAFARYVDDLVDDKLIPKYAINEKLDKLEILIHDITLEEKEKNPILYALDDTIKKYNIPLEYFNDLIEGVRMDLNITEFVTTDQLDLYCYRVASVIGLISCYIFGPPATDPKALEYATDLGKGMQITNILRDISEDFERGRIYIPKELRDKYDVPVHDLVKPEESPNLIRLIKSEIVRARKYYESGKLGFKYLPRRALFTVRLAAEVYGEILDEIEKMNYKVLRKRAYVPKWKKIKIATKLRLQDIYYGLIGRD